MFEEMVNTAKTNDKEKEALLLLSLEEKYNANKHKDKVN